MANNVKNNGFHIENNYSINNIYFQGEVSGCILKEIADIQELNFTLFHLDSLIDRILNR